MYWGWEIVRFKYPPPLWIQTWMWGKMLYTMCWCWQNIGFKYPPPPVWIQIYTYIQTYTMVIALSTLSIEQAHAACLKISKIAACRGGDQKWSSFIFTCKAAVSSFAGTTSRPVSTFSFSPSHSDELDSLSPSSELLPELDELFPSVIRRDRDSLQTDPVMTPLAHKLFRDCSAPWDFEDWSMNSFCEAAQKRQGNTENTGNNQNTFDNRVSNGFLPPTPHPPARKRLWQQSAMGSKCPCRHKTLMLLFHFDLVAHFTKGTRRLHVLNQQLELFRPFRASAKNAHKIWPNLETNGSGSM